MIEILRDPNLTILYNSFQLLPYFYEFWYNEVMQHFHHQSQGLGGLAKAVGSLSLKPLAKAVPGAQLQTIINCLDL